MKTKLWKALLVLSALAMLVVAAGAPYAGGGGG